MYVVMLLRLDPDTSESVSAGKTQCAKFALLAKIDSKFGGESFSIYAYYNSNSMRVADTLYFGKIADKDLT